MRPSRIALVTGALALTACSSSSGVVSPTTGPVEEATTPTVPPVIDGDPAWAQPASDYFGALLEALNAKQAEPALAFFGEDVVLVSVDGDELYGLRRFEYAVEAALADPDAARSRGDVYLGPGGDGGGVALLLSRVRYGEVSGCPVGGSCEESIATAVAVSGGLVTELRETVSNADARARLTAAAAEGVEVSAESLDDADAFYQAQAEAWSAHAPDRVAAAFASFGLLADGLASSSARGLQEIEAYAAGRFAAYPDLRLEPVTLAEVGMVGREGPAVFVAPFPSSEGGFRSGVGVYRLRLAPDVSALMALLWQVSDGKITAQTAVYEPASLESLIAAGIDVPTSGWWSSLRIPTPPEAVVTGSVDLPGGGRVEITNGTPELEALVQWGVHRFGRAGIGVPAPTRIGFPPDVRCREGTGLAVDTGAGVEVQLCFGVEEACGGTDCLPSRVARFNLLHELGHVWSTQYLSEERRAAFMALRGLDVWWDPNSPWDAQGVEHAAEVIAWALMDEEVPVARLPRSSPELLAEAFRSLTGAVPPPRG
jgi:hypothetical protein